MSLASPETGPPLSAVLQPAGSLPAVPLSVSSVPVTRRVEGPTLILAAAIYGLWGVALVAPPWIGWGGSLILGAWAIAWHASLQHEILHGHPTPWRWVNALLAWPPLSLWLPYCAYRESHLVHHCDERLTDPLADPETWYWTADDWAALNPVARRLVAAQQTLLGRLTLGPAWVMGTFWRRQARRLRAGEGEAWRRLLIHLLLTVGVITLVWAAGLPLWLYAAMVYGGTALMLLRSFAEHRASPDPAHRTAIVEDAGLLGWLFLFNNLHVVHHDHPGLPWYRLRAVYRAHRERLIAKNGGLVYRGYREVARRYGLRAHDRLIHPGDDDWPGCQSRHACPAPL